MGKGAKETIACHHCGTEADITLAGFEGVKDVVRRMKKAVCKSCGQEVEMEKTEKETYACDHCGAEADMTVEGFEKVEDVIKREKGFN